MNILITGNLGYVGGVLTRYLREKYPQALLVGVDSGFFVDQLTSVDAPPELLLDRQLSCDIRDISLEQLQGFDAVVHLAAVSNDPIGKSFEQATESINLTGTLALAAKAKSAHVGRFVLASSCSVYGAAAEELVDESGILNPLTAYARSKVDSEQQLAQLADDSFQVSCLRFGTACGYAPRTRLDLVVNDFVASSIANKEIYLLSSGNAWRPFIHVEDMARAIDWALHRDGVAIEVVNIGSAAMTLRVNALAELTATIISDAKVTYAQDASPDNRSYQVDFSRYQRLAPDYQPQWDMPATIQDLVENFQKIGFSNGNFRTSLLIRLNSLRQLIESGQLDEQLRWSSPTVLSE
ncbi:NAD-dependent epimerase/dehydratase family protein [Dasania marina]|uniref:NAD-dependent epimerase/dehydratase family protein n=1 Tax=Dasania marina TaxID=471499 RepID=UPI000379C65C|nr:SDR family oxidoreductase [Dasania marina]